MDQHRNEFKRSNAGKDVSLGDHSKKNLDVTDRPQHSRRSFREKKGVKRIEEVRDSVEREIVARG